MTQTMHDMTDTTNYDRALDHISAVQAARMRLSELYKRPASEANGKAVAENHQAIGHGLKSAEVHASLAVADELAGIGMQLDGIAQELRDRLPLTGTVES